MYSKIDIRHAICGFLCPQLKSFLSWFFVPSLKVFYSGTVISQSLALYVTFNTDLGLFPIFTSLPLPIWPSSHLPPSSSLGHCHSASNLPAILAFPHTMFLTANLYSGRMHLSPGRLRSAALSLPAPWAAHSSTCSPALCDSIWTFLLWIWQMWTLPHRMRGTSQTHFWRVSDMLV